MERVGKGEPGSVDREGVPLGNGRVGFGVLVSRVYWEDVLKTGSLRFHT